MIWSFQFDNYYNECYIIETNGIMNKKIHKIMQYYVSSKGYKYIILENEGIILNINNRFLPFMGFRPKKI